MIKRINRIKNLAVFHDFLWRGGIPDFSKINLIYGYNYSGKTSLSRLFSSLRDKRLHEDYPHMEFELQLQDGDRISHREISDFPLSVLVFNRDYLDKQLRISSKTEWDGIAFDLGQNADTRGLIEEVETGIKLNKDEEGKHKGIIAEFQKFENEEFTAWGIDVRKKVYNKTENYDKNPAKASFYTGIAYIFAVVILVCPYFIFKNVYLCLTVTVFNAIILILAFSFYISVAKDLSFKKRFFEMMPITIGISALTFGIGFIVSLVFNVVP